MACSGPNGNVAFSHHAVLYLQQHARGLCGVKRGNGSRKATGAEPVGSGRGEFDWSGPFGAHSPVLKFRNTYATARDFLKSGSGGSGYHLHPRWLLHHASPAWA
jgi:hypothetical protein